MTRSVSRRIAEALVAGLCPLLAVGPARAASPASLAGGQRADVQAAAAAPDGASPAGVLASTTSLRVTLALRPRDAAALAREARAVSDPSSARYHRYLSVAQFASRFGASAASRATVQRTLRQSGLAVSPVSSNGLSLTASGTAAEIEGAFDTSLQRIRLADGHAAYTDTATPTLPTAAAALVEGISGLDSLPVSAPESLPRAAPSGRAHSDARAQVSAQTTSTAGPSSCRAAAGSGNSAQDIASAYGLDGLWSEGDVGAGTTVALYELQPYSAQDVAAYQSCYGTSATVTDVAVDGGASCGSGGSDCGVEDVLDIEDVAGLAPGATIDVYEGPNTGAGAYDTYAAIVQADSARVVSTSWGLCETGENVGALSAENTLFQEAALQGQTVLAASGDSGVAGCGTRARSVDDPASEPYVTGVGGTSLPSYRSPSSQTVWNDGHGAGGGGVSSEWTQPYYQSDPAANAYAITCPTSLGSASLTTSCREVPDVSADADPETGYAIYYAGDWGEYGGTSAAAPTWAALVALADSSSYCTSAGVSVGFANPLLYALPASDFTDVTAGNNTFDGVSGYRAQSGYDMASGLGTPDGALLVPALCGSSAAVSEPAATTLTTSTAPTAAPPATTPAPTAPTTTTTTTTTRSSGAKVEFTAPHRRRATVGHRVHERLRAHDRLDLRLAYSARDLPAGLHIDRRTGTIVGVLRHAGRFTSSITATDTGGNAHSIVIRWTVLAH